MNRGSQAITLRGGMLTSPPAPKPAASLPRKESNFLHEPSFGIGSLKKKKKIQLTEGNF